MSEQNNNVVSIDRTPGIGHNRLTETELHAAIRPGIDRWKASKDLVEKSRKIAGKGRETRDEARAELRASFVTLSAHMAEGRRLLGSDKQFGNWLDGQFDYIKITPHDRAALIKMGRVPQEDREKILRETKFWSPRKIWDRDFKPVYGTDEERAIAEAAAAQADRDDDPDTRAFEDGLLQEIFGSVPDLSEDDIYNALEILACRLPLKVDGGFGLETFNRWLGRWVKNRRAEKTRASIAPDADT